MLDVNGAGATATVDRDWHGVWVNSQECQEATEKLNAIHDEEREQSPVWDWKSEVHLCEPLGLSSTQRRKAFLTYWRDPTYLMSKLVLNILGGLFIEFTFFDSKDTIQDSQNKLFVSYFLLGGTSEKDTSCLRRYTGYFHGHCSG